MKDFKKFFRGFGKKICKTTNDDILNEVKNLNTNICDRNYDLLEDNSKTKDKYFKLENEYKETLKLVELREKDNKALEKTNRNLRQQLNDATSTIESITNKLDSIMNNQEDILDLVKEFKGNVYEVKKVRSCTGSKQKIQVKSSAKNSSIIKKVVGTGEK